MFVKFRVESSEVGVNPDHVVRVIPQGMFTSEVRRVKPWSGSALVFGDGTHLYTNDSFMESISLLNSKNVGGRPRKDVSDE